MRTRLLVFLLLCLAFVGAMSLMVVSEAPAEEAHQARLPMRIEAPTAPMPLQGQATPARAEGDVTDISLALYAPRLSFPGRPEEISPLAYPQRAYYAFHYADEAG